MRKLLTVEEVAKRQGVSTQTVRNRIKDETVKVTLHWPWRMTIEESKKIKPRMGGRPPKGKS